MTQQSRISINIHGQNVPDKAALLDFLVKLNPAWVLVMNNFGLCLEIKALLPDCNVIHRGWGNDGDENDHKQFAPGQWVAQKLREVNGADIWCYTTNEPEFGPEVMRWHVEVMKLAATSGLKLVVGNFGVGNPVDVDHDWEQAETMLRLLDMHRDTMVLGLHEYACGVITSGFVGGSPADQNIILPAQWPEDASKLAKWHCGRFEFLVKHCESIGMNPPRIVITEHGFDDVSDIKAWTETLIKAPTFGNPGGNIRGWKTLDKQWYRWFYEQVALWLPQRAYFEQLKYANEKIYQGSVVEAQLIYCWGHSSDIWAQFDIAEAQELRTSLIEYARQGNPPPPVIDAPPVVRVPEYLGIQTTARNTSAAGRVIRHQPNDVDGKQIGMIPPGATFTAYQSATVTDGKGWTWTFIEVGEKHGWVANILDWTGNDTPAPPETPNSQPLTEISELRTELADMKARVAQLETLLTGFGQAIVNQSNGKVKP